MLSSLLDRRNDVASQINYVASFIPSIPPIDQLCTHGKHHPFHPQVKNDRKIALYDKNKLCCLGVTEYEIFQSFSTHLFL